MGAIKMLVFLLFVWVTCVLSQGPPPPESVEFVMNIVSPVYVCTDEDSLSFIDPSDLETKRFNETFTFMTGQITFLKDFDHSIMVEVVILKEASGKFEVVFTHEICDLCAEIGNLESDYYTYLQYCGFPDECPFPAGAYKVSDLIADTNDVPVNSANSGSYLISINFYKNPDGTCKNEKIFLGCVKLDVVIEPL